MDSANIILGHKNPVIPTAGELEQEKLTLNQLRNQNALGERQMQMQKELEGVTDPLQAAKVIGKYDPLKGMELQAKFKEQGLKDEASKKERYLAGINYYGKQAGILTNLYDDAVRQGVNPQEATSKIMPLYQRALQQGRQLYPDVEVQDTFEGIDALRQDALQADEFLKQYMANQKYGMERSDKLADTESERKYQDIVRKEQQGFQISQQDRQFANQYKLQKDSQGFTSGQNALSRGVTIRGQDMSKKTAENKIDWKYDAGSDEFVAPPTAEFPSGRRSGNVAKQKAQKSLQYVADKMLTSIDETTQGGIMGLSGVVGKVTDSQNQRRFDNLREQMTTELRTLFRIPGEGSLSDKEQAQYGIQLPDVKNSKENNRAIVEDILNRTAIRNNQNENPMIMSREDAKLSGQIFQAPPNPAKYNGKTIIDDATGVKLRSNGKQWIKVQ